MTELDKAYLTYLNVSLETAEKVLGFLAEDYHKESDDPEKSFKDYNLMMEFDESRSKIKAIKDHLKMVVDVWEKDA